MFNEINLFYLRVYYTTTAAGTAESQRLYHRDGRISTERFRVQSKKYLAFFAKISSIIVLGTTHLKCVLL